MPTVQKHVQQTAEAPRTPDMFDRRILSALAADAARSYSELGKIVGLSAPAVHERVKRLKASGVIKGMVALIDGPAVGKPLLAFVHVDTRGWGKTPAMMALSELPEVEELHSVTGDTCVLVKVRVASSQALEAFLAKVYDLEGVRGTRTYVALSTFLERPVQGAVSL